MGPKRAAAVHVMHRPSQRADQFRAASRPQWAGTQAVA